MIAVQIIAEWLFCFIEVVMYFSLVHAVKPEQFPKKKQICLFLVIASVISGGILLLNLVNFTSLMMTMLYGIIAWATGASILYKGKFSELILIDIYYLTGLNLVEGFMLRLVGIIWSPELVTKVVDGFCVERMVVVSSFKLIEIIMVCFICLLMKRLSVELKPTWWSFLISIIGVFVVLFWVIQVSDVLNMKANLFEGVVAAVCVLVCYLLYFLFQLRRIRQEQEHAALENKLLKMNYQAAEEAYESNAKLYHDMRNHFSLLQTYLAEGKVAEAQQYLQKLGGESHAYAVEKWTGVEAIDYILSQKVVSAESMGIQTEIHAEYPKECGIDPVDLCTILTNLMDNAIEACARQPEGMERNISLTIRRIHQFIIIRLSNSAASEPVMKQGRLVTSKQDAEHHGWGTRSVQSAVEKYQGTVEYSYENQTFTVNVMMFYQ